MKIPTINEVRSFTQNEKLNVDADAFYNYCVSKDWKMKDSSPMERWQAILIICHQQGKFKKKRSNSVVTDRLGSKNFIDENGIQWSVMDEENPDPADVALYGGEQ